MSIKYFVPLAFLLLIAGCGIDGDDETNLPFIEVFTPDTEVTGEVVLEYRIRDRTGRFMNVFPFFPASSGIPATLAASSEPTTDRQADSFGVIYTITWDTLTDLGPGLHVNQVFQMDAVGRDGRSPASFTAPFVVNNSDGLGVVEGEFALNVVRNNGVAAQAPDSSLVWALGENAAGQALSSTLLFSLASNEFFAGPDLSGPREGATAVREPRGVLILGGRQGGSLISGAELIRLDFSPAAVESAGNLQISRDNAEAIELADGRVLVVGGSDGVNNVSTVEIYSNGAFQTLFTDARLALQGHKLVRLLNGDVLVVGGTDNGGNVVSTILQITVSGNSGSITQQATLATARTEAGALKLDNGQVFIAGGTSNGLESGALNSVELYTAGAATTSTFVASLSEARINPGLSETDRTIAIIGGRGNGQNAQTSEKFLLSTGQVETIRYQNSGLLGRSTAFKLGDGRSVIIGDDHPASFYYPRSSAEEDQFRRARGNGLAVANAAAFALEPFSEIVLVGGTRGYGMSSDIHVFRVAAGTFEFRGRMIEPRINHAVTNIDFFPRIIPLVIAGGRTPTGVTARCEVTDASFGVTTATGSLNFARENHAALTLADGQVIVVGGRDPNGNVLGSVEAFDRNTGVWSVVSNMITPRSDFAVFLLPGTAEFIVAGGVDSAGNPLDTVEMYDPGNKTFRVIATLNQARAKPNLAFDENFKFLAVCGGSSGSTPLASGEIIDIREEQLLQTFSLLQPRANSDFAVMTNGNTLLIGGTNGTADPGPEIVSIVENNGVPTVTTRRPTDQLPQVQRQGAIVRTLARVPIIVGGINSDGVTLSGAELFRPPQ